MSKFRREPAIFAYAAAGRQQAVALERFFGHNAGVPSVLKGFRDGFKARHASFYRWAHVVVPLSLLLALIGVRIHDSNWVELARLNAFDAFVRARPRPYQDAGVRIIDVDEESLKRLGQWPWPRATLGRFVSRLRDAGAAAIAFDMVFPEPDRLGPAQDAAFAKAIAGGRVVLGVPMAKRDPGRPVKFTPFADRGELERFALKHEGLVPNLESFDRGAAGIGTFTTGVENDGVIRRVPLIQVVGDYRVPALALDAMRVAFGARMYQVLSAKQETHGRQDTGITGIRMQLPPGSGKKAVILPTDEHGRMWHYPTEDTPARVVPAWEVFDKGFDASKVQGCILFVGTSAEGLRDIRATALNPVAAGVTVHANLVEQVVLEEYLKRPDWAFGAEVLTMLFFGILLTLLLSRFGAAVCLPIALGGLAFSIGMPWYYFTRHGLLLDPVFPSIATGVIYLASTVISYLKSELERRQVKGAFSRYMSPALVEQLAKHPEKLRLGGETREMTWHFCDIRGFTTISEQFDPHGLVQFINRFLTPMTELILQHQGVIDKYMGDCIMAFWNAPLDDAEHARHACQAALMMHEKLAELNAAWEAEAKAEGRKYIPIHIGTGLNTGSCVVGNMGSDQRFDYSVLGDEVNLASRLEGQSKTYGVNIVIGPNTRAKAPEFAALELDLIKVKGKTVPVRIYALLGGPELAQDPSFKAHEEKHARMIEAYRAKRFDETRELLAECRKTDLPLSKLYDLYEHRLDAFAEQAPPADWDGTFTATTK